jgi:hypothetical protein
MRWGHLIDNQINENDIGRHVISTLETTNAYRISIRNPKEITRFGYQGIDKRIILILNK